MLIRLEKTLVNKISRFIGNPMVINEHFVPMLGTELDPYIKARNKTAVHHLLRYQWARCVLDDIAPKRALLDIACGSGYGSYMLAQAFPDCRVVGADYDRAAIQHAQKNYVLPNLAYTFGDTNTWVETIGDSVFDCVVSFDTLEHVDHRDIMMENLVAHLSPSGCLLLSTPCGRDANNVSPRWVHHRLEYSAASLYDFLRRYFETIVRPDGPDFPHSEVFDQIEGTGITYELKLNPVVCLNPITVQNPYRSSAQPPVAATAPS
jgi:2-polyprenyl-3-methyl-5-hydroxy-6-metoxy-1,4-benzoquinol methylase